MVIQVHIKIVKARLHGAMCDCDLLYQEMECCLRFSDFCSHGSIGLDAICNVLTLESHIAITQNGCRT